MKEYRAFNISLPNELVERMERQRGDVTRSRFIMRALERTLNIGGKKKD